ncbi:MAG TPA: Gfo/Idh/MocA family oxidoreductase, partial [Anaerolineales bacterium]
MSRPVGIAILGLGGWSRKLAAAALRSQKIDLLTCYTRTPETRQAFAAEFGCLAAGSLEEALTTPGVEAALITSPSHTHLALARACAEHGRHVFVEKAMALTYADGLKMIREVHGRGLTLMVGHEMRRLGSHRAMKQILESGRLGQVSLATAGFTLAGSFMNNNWRTSRNTNRGGALMQLGIHQIENLIYLLGPVAQVRGFFAHTTAPVDVDDVGIANLIFESGAAGSVASTFVSPPTYEIHLFGSQMNLHCGIDMRVWPDARQVDPNTTLSLQRRDGGMKAQNHGTAFG